MESCCAWQTEQDWSCDSGAVNEIQEKVANYNQTLCVYDPVHRLDVKPVRLTGHVTYIIVSIVTSALACLSSAFDTPHYYKELMRCTGFQSHSSVFLFFILCALSGVQTNLASDSFCNAGVMTIQIFVYLDFLTPYLFQISKIWNRNL